MSLNRKNTLSKIIYTPLIFVFLIPAVYLIGAAYIASIQPSENCSFVPLFVALGLILGASALGMIFNLEFGSLYVRTGKRIFAFFSAVLDLIASGASGLIGFSLLSDGAPAAMRIIFLAISAATATCFVVNLIRIFKKNWKEKEYGKG